MQILSAYAIGILSGTPLWVWGLLALLIWLGAQGLKARVLRIERLAIVPLVFILWGLSGVAMKPFAGSLIAVLWLGGLAAGAAIGALTGPRLLGVDHARRRVQLPASVGPLARNLIFFCANYALNVMAAIRHGEAAIWLQATIVVSGLSAGYFTGWGLSLWRRYRQAPEQDLAPAAMPRGGL